MEEQRVRELIHEEMRVVMRPQPGEILKLQYELQDARRKITELEAEQKKSVSGETAEIVRLGSGNHALIDLGNTGFRILGPATLVVIGEDVADGIGVQDQTNEMRTCDCDGNYYTKLQDMQPQAHYPITTFRSDKPGMLGSSSDRFGYNRNEPGMNNPSPAKES